MRELSLPQTCMDVIQSPIRRSWRMRMDSWMRKHGEAIVYRGAGVALRVPRATAGDCVRPLRVIRQAYLEDFWSPRSRGAYFDLVVAILLWPIAVPIAAAWLSCKNGKAVYLRSGKGRLRQWREQLSQAARHGILPLWYYIFELYRPAFAAQAADFIGRAESKEGAYQILARRWRPASSLSDKLAFAERCEQAGLALPDTLAVARGGELMPSSVSPAALPRADLFVKPVRASGGRGALRWDYVGNDHYKGPGEKPCSAAEILDHLRALSRDRPMLLQPRLTNHPALLDLSSGALSTVRVLTCLSERKEPEVMGAVFRMSIGTNRTVDNLHAGGIASPVDLISGMLGLASDLGSDARLGWIDRHPSTGAMIAGQVLPYWAQVLDLAVKAHRVFADHVVAGWDIAITPSGVSVIEGNSGPDLDIMQRMAHRPLGSTRFADLLAHHLDH